MDRCPNCRARWDGGRHCRRCGMELTQLLAVEHAAHRLVARAVAHLGEGDAEAAVAALARARALYREPFTDRLLGFAHAMRREVAGGRHESRAECAPCPPSQIEQLPSLLSLSLRERVEGPGIGFGIG